MDERVNALLSHTGTSVFSDIDSGGIQYIVLTFYSFLSLHLYLLQFVCFHVTRCFLSITQTQKIA